MVLPAKIFMIKEEVDMGLIAMKLKNFRSEESYQTESGETFNLITEILELNLDEDSVSGVFSADFVRRRYYRRKLVETPVTEEAIFWIKRFKERAFLIVLAPSVARGVKMLLTGNVANRLSEILFIKPHVIVEARISHETLRKLHESNPQATKLIWFDDVDIPGVEKLCLAGSDLVDTQLYREYLQHGRIWYVVFEVQKRGIVVGITRNCVVTLFSKSTTDDFLSYITEELLTLIE
ncbi:MAG: hypothetical protein QXX08_00825 [Candidatus Bathyarchaeia archaeon]